MALIEITSSTITQKDARNANEVECNDVIAFISYLSKSIEPSTIESIKDAIKKLQLENNLYFINDTLTDKKNINSFLFKLNHELLKTNEIAVGIIETTDDWKSKRKIFKTPIFKWLIRFWTFIFYRFLPKQRFFQFITGNATKRLYSKAEILGRLIYSGFELLDLIQFNGCHLVVVKRSHEPNTNKTSEGFILKMKRIGKNGELFNVFKVRTMHPYSEYLHEYMIKNHGFNEKGKIKNDFRMAKWGKVLRKYWLDEIPQLLNVLKGQMKLVGVRPVSKSYFDSLPIEIQQKRLTQKPGCIPPYVAHEFGTTKEAVLQAELKYLEDKIQKPYSTDIRYFFIALYKIVFKGKRSS